MGNRSRRGAQEVEEAQGEGDKLTTIYTDAVATGGDANAPTSNGEDYGGYKIVDEDDKRVLGATSHADAGEEEEEKDKITGQEDIKDYQDQLEEKQKVVFSDEGDIDKGGRVNKEKENKGGQVRFPPPSIFIPPLLKDSSCS